MLIERDSLIAKEKIKKREKIESDIEEVKNTLRVAKAKLKSLGKKGKIKECCEGSDKIVIPKGNPINYTEKEYRNDFYKKFKHSTFSKTEINDLCLFTLGQANPVFKPEPKIVKKNEIFSEHSESGSESFESDYESE